MIIKRRQFIKTTAAGIALTAVTGNILGCTSSSSMAGEKLSEFGLQLYTLRDVLPNNPKGVLKQLADMGYKQIESYNHDTLGMFWGMSNKEFKKYMDDLGMKLVSSHCDINKNFEKQVDDAAEIGMNYLLCPSLDNEKNMNKDACKNFADIFNQKGSLCKSKGIKFGYHNHDGPLNPRDGNVTLLDILIQNTDPSLVDFEMDIYWVVTAGQDPVKWFEKYPNRFRLCHIKDRKKNIPLTDREESVDLGKGSIDFRNILKVAKQKGMEYFIVEQEKYEGTTPLAAAKADADYMKDLKI